jgi:hypothetical protein
MRIIENFIVDGQQWAVMNTSSGDNDLIGWITMKLTGKLGGLDRYPRRQFKQLNTRITESRVHPFVNRAVKGKSIYFHKLGNFPA